MSAGDHGAVVAGAAAAAVALVLFGLITTLIPTLVRRWSGRMERRFARIEAMIAEVRSPAPDPYRRLVEAATEALAAHRAIFNTCWNDRDRRAFTELEAALEEVRSRAVPATAPGA